MAKLALRGGEPVRRKEFPSWPIYDERELEALRAVLESGKWGIGGERKAEFERRFAEYHGVRFGVAVVNGTAALEISLRAAGVPAGSKVLMPAYTFMATATASIYCNLIPKFVDIDPDTYTIDPKAMEESITGDEKAVIPVHIAGCPADMERITSIAERNGLVVVEDACQAWGAEWGGRRVGSFGDLSAFSFQSSKNITSGEGGIILTDDKELYEKAWSYHNCGRRMKGLWYEHFIPGTNCRMTEFQAAILLVQLERLPEQTRIRNERAAYLTRKLSRIDGITPLKRPEKVTNHAYHLYIFRYDEEAFGGLPREVFIEALNAEGIPCSPGYRPLYKLPAFQRLGEIPFIPRELVREMDYSKVRLPNTERACYKEAVWLRQNELLGSEEDMDDIVAAVEKIKDNVDELL
ncbi:DegT/DnrJ/EryC1/StrS family aminotransferase [Candidatus Bathyarchaeota archaeon]|nr:MAG: DegT/DnrJ/EryC1/StrS family aminotransferase [Candidatus Bathyarchaeota archaeon]